VETERGVSATYLNLRIYNKSRGTNSPTQRLRTPTERTGKQQTFVDRFRASATAAPKSREKQLEN